MAQNQNNVAAERAAGAGAGPGPANQQGPAIRGRIVILNAFPLNALPRRHVQLDILPVGVNDLVAWVQRRLAEGFQLVHYVRHVGTIQALRSIGIPLSSEPNSGLYAYDAGDIIVVVTLRTPTRGQEVAQLSPQDLEAWIITVL
jgi:hypothetical protein